MGPRLWGPQSCHLGATVPQRVLARSSVSLVTTHYEDRVPRSRAQCVFLNKDLCTALCYQQGESLGFQECKPYNHHSQWPIPTTLRSAK